MKETKKTLSTTVAKSNKTFRFSIAEKVTLWKRTSNKNRFIVRKSSDSVFVPSDGTKRSARVGVLSSALIGSWACFRGGVLDLRHEENRSPVRFFARQLQFRFFSQITIIFHRTNFAEAKPFLNREECGEILF